MAQQSLASLKLGLSSFVGQPGRDPVLELLAKCGVQAVADQIAGEAQKAADDTSQVIDDATEEATAATEQAAQVAAQRIAEEVQKKIKILQLQWEAAVAALEADPATGWDKAYEVLYSQLSKELGLGAAVIQAVAVGEIQAWAKGFEADIQRTGQELSDIANTSLTEIEKQVAGLPQKAVDALGQMVADSLGIPELTDPDKLIQKVKDAVPEELRPAAGPIIDKLVAGQAPSEDETKAMTAALQKQAISEATKFVASSLNIDPDKTVELVDGILNLPDRPSFDGKGSGFEGVKAYAGVAQTALQLLGQDQAAQDLGKALAIAQTGMQIYQATSVLMAASGWGVALGAVSVLGGMGSLGGALGGLGGGGGNDNSAVLGAIQKLQEYLAKQFKVLHERLDRIDENLALLQQTLNEVKATVEELRWRLISVQGDTRDMQTQLALGTLAILEEIDEQRTVQWDAVVGGKLSLTAADVVQYKAFFHSRVLDAFDQARTLAPTFEKDPFDELARLTRALSTQRDQDLPGFVNKNISGKGSAPIALLLSAVNHYTARDLKLSKSTVTKSRASVNPAIALGAIERWLQVHQAQKKVKGLSKSAEGLTGLSRSHLKDLRRALDCVEGICGMVKPPAIPLASLPPDYKPSSTFEVLMGHLDGEVLGLQRDFDRLEWAGIYTFLHAAAALPGQGGEPVGHRDTWPSVAASTAPDFPFDIPADQTLPWPYKTTLEVGHQFFQGQLPGLTRNLSGQPESAFRVYAELPGLPTRDPVSGSGDSGTLGLSFNIKLYLHGVEVTTLAFTWNVNLYYDGKLSLDGSATNDYIWHRAGNPNYRAPYERNPRWLLFWSEFQPAHSNDNRHCWFDIPNRTIYGVVRSRLATECTAITGWLQFNRNFDSVGDAYDGAVSAGQNTLALILKNGIQPQRSAIFKDFLARELAIPNEGSAHLAPIRARLKLIQNLLVTVRAALLVGMPSAYLQLDLLHALYDGGTKGAQLRLPWTDLFERQRWADFLGCVEEEIVRVGAGLPAVSHCRDVKHPLPYGPTLARSIYLLKRCIDKMAEISPSTAIPARVALASDALRYAELEAGLRPGGSLKDPIQPPKADALQLSGGMAGAERDAQGSIQVSGSRKPKDSPKSRPSRHAQAPAPADGRRDAKGNGAAEAD